MKLLVPTSLSDITLESYLRYLEQLNLVEKDNLPEYYLMTKMLEIFCNITEAEAKKEDKTPRKRSAGPAKPGLTLSVDDLKAEGIDEQQAKDWLKVRKDKRLSLTLSAWDGIKAEIDRAAITPAQAIAECNTRGWGGFRADWYAKDSSSQASNGHGIL